jgi:D-glycero-alpha-D-manno-heptose-7-phosphate kinase
MVIGSVLRSSAGRGADEDRPRSPHSGNSGETGIQILAPGGDQRRMLIRARAPLRLGLAGGGTDLSPFCDLYGGCVLNATIDLYAYAHIDTSDNGTVGFAAPDIGAEICAPVAAAYEIDTPQLALHQAVYTRVVNEFCQGRPLPMRMTTFCEAPPGSGLGSSSTLVVAMLRAFTEWLHLPLGDYDIAHLAFQVERRDVGLNGGRQDQYATTFGGFNFMEFYADDRVIVNPLRIKNWIISEFEASLVLFYTGTSRYSAQIIDEQTRNIESGSARSIQAMVALKEDAVKMKEAILKGDFAVLASCLNRSWHAKKQTADSVSNPQIERIFERAMASGALAGKVSGAGGGGFIMFLVDPARRMDVIRALGAKGDGRVLACHFTKRGTEAWRID